MKTILYFLLGIILCLSVPNVLNAQEVEDPQEAFAKEAWYLTKIVMEGEEYPFVPSGGVPNSLLYTSELETYNENVHCDFEVYYCEMCGTTAYFLSDTEFKIIGWGDCLAYDNCMYTTDPYILEFSHLYESVFWNRSYTSDNEESFYEINITETEGNLSMVITKDNGNQAYYSDENLSVPSLEKNEITLYPNPVKDQLYIENLTEKATLEIYDFSGRILKQQEISSSTESIDVSQLSVGMYFYSIQQNGKGIKTGKLVKK